MAFSFSLYLSLSIEILIFYTSAIATPNSQQTKTMKQKVVIKVPMNGQKCRSKALKIAVGVSGVESAALAGQDKNEIVVIGDGIDAVALTTLLRKNVGFSELVSVGPVPEKKEGGGGGDQKKNEATVHIPVGGFYYPYTYPYPYGQGPVYEIRHTNPDPCSIM